LLQPAAAIILSSNILLTSHIIIEHF